MKAIHYTATHFSVRLKYYIIRQHADINDNDGLLYWQEPYITTNGMTVVYKDMSELEKELQKVYQIMDTFALRTGKNVNSPQNNNYLNAKIEGILND